MTNNDYKQREDREKYFTNSTHSRAGGNLLANFSFWSLIPTSVGIKERTKRMIKLTRSKSVTYKLKQA